MAKLVTLMSLPVGAAFQTTASKRVGMRVAWPEDWVEEPPLGADSDLTVFFDNGEPVRVRGGLVVEKFEDY